MMSDVTPKGFGQDPVYSLQDIFDTLTSPMSFQEALDRILTVSLRELRADQGSLLLLDKKDPHTLKMLASQGLPQEIVRRGYVPRKGSISEFVLRERRPLIINDVPKNEDFESMASDTSVPRVIHSALCVPLICRGSVLGTMNLNRTREQLRFEQSDLETCSIIASQAAIVIANRQLQQELLEKERLAAVGQTVAGISHCIKNILAGVRGGLGLTEMGLRDNRTELVREGFELLKRNTRVLSNLVLDLLDYSKERQPIRDYFSISETVDNVLENVEFKARSAGVVVEKHVSKDIRFFGDQDQIFRALLNLVTNAVEACSEYFRPGQLRRVQVSAWTERPSQLPTVPQSPVHAEEWVAIEVKDNGPGVPEEARDQIWGLFYSTKGSRGTGIGLAATRKMIEEHGGFITLESSPQQGATFTAMLPILTYIHPVSAAPMD